MEFFVISRMSIYAICALVYIDSKEGAENVRAREITDEMKVAAAYAIASVIKEDELRADYILPDAFNPEVVKAVAKAVSDEAVRSGKARI